MTLRSIHAHASRPLRLAAATSIALVSWGPLQAQVPGWHPSRPAAQPASREPARLPTTATQAAPLTGTATITQTAGQVNQPPKSAVQQQLELLYQQNGQQMPQMVEPARIVVEQNATPMTRTTAASAQAAERESKTTKVGFFDKIKSVFKKDATRKSPPQDPGMNYPTVSGRQMRAQPAPAGNPARTGQASISGLNIPPAPAVAPQPNLLQLPGGANPIPSSNQSMELLAPPSQMAAQPQGQQPQLRLQRPQPETAESQTAPPQPQDLPRFDMNGAASTAPASEVAAVPSNEQRAPAPGEPHDPFTNLFPDDEQHTPAATTAQASPSADPQQTIADLEIDLPEPDLNAEESTTEVAAAEPAPAYTGLTLEDDLFEDMPMAPNPPVDAIAESGKSKESAAKSSGAASGKTDAQQSPLMAPLPEQGLQVAEAPSTASQQNAPLLNGSPAPDVAEVSGKSSEEKPTDKSTLPKITASPANASKTVPPKDVESKMSRIAARKDQQGLKGFCPVALHDRRELVDVDESYTVVFQGRRYSLSSQDAMDAFLQDPLKYAPASGGNDVIHLALTGEELTGSLDYAVWYKGRLYLFASAETMDTFVAAPSSHVSLD